MDWADYLRDEAAKYRQLAETAEDLSIKQELLDLAAVCEEAANNIEDRIPGRVTWRWRTATWTARRFERHEQDNHQAAWHFCTR
jgi:hypothetical protein